MRVTVQSNICSAMVGRILLAGDRKSSAGREGFSPECVAEVNIWPLRAMLAHRNGSPRASLFAHLHNKIRDVRGLDGIDGLSCWRKWVDATRPYGDVRYCCRFAATFLKLHTSSLVTFSGTAVKEANIASLNTVGLVATGFQVAGLVICTPAVLDEVQLRRDQRDFPPPPCVAFFQYRGISTPRNVGGAVG